MTEDKPKVPVKRRPKGEGSVHQLSNGSWKVTVTIGTDQKGDQKRKSYTVKGQKEALQILNKFRSEVYAGTSTPTQSITMTEFIERWLLGKAKSVKESSLATMKSIANNHIKPFFGKHKVQKVNTRLINQYYEDRLSNNIAPVTLAVHRSTLHNILDSARREGIIPTNPVEDSDHIAVYKEDVMVLNQEQAKKLLNTAKDNPKMFSSNHVYYVVKLALATGLRKGELMALRWTDITEDSLTVRGTVVVLKGSRKIGTPKSNSSHRTIDVDPVVLKELQDIHRPCEEFVFSKTSGVAFHPSTMAKSFDILKRKAGLSSLRFHDLRHTHATQLIASGMDISTISKRLDHASISTTLNTYSHWIKSKDVEAALYMGSWLNS